MRRLLQTTIYHVKVLWNKDHRAKKEEEKRGRTSRRFFGRMVCNSGPGSISPPAYGRESNMNSSVRHRQKTAQHNPNSRLVKVLLVNHSSPSMKSSKPSESVGERVTTQSLGEGMVLEMERRIG
jgi:hypothetical protein